MIETPTSMWLKSRDRWPWRLHWSFTRDEREAGGVFPDFYIPHVPTALESGGRGVDGGLF